MLERLFLNQAGVNKQFLRVAKPWLSHSVYALEQSPDGEVDLSANGSIKVKARRNGLVLTEVIKTEAPDTNLTLTNSVNVIFSKGKWKVGRVKQHREKNIFDHNFYDPFHCQFLVVFEKL